MSEPTTVKVPAGIPIQEVTLKPGDIICMLMEDSAPFVTLPKGAQLMPMPPDPPMNPNDIPFVALRRVKELVIIHRQKGD